jgi:vitamin B12 transporter
MIRHLFACFTLLATLNFNCFAADFSGRVQDSTGAPIEGATVVLYVSQQNYTILRARSDASGRFTLQAAEAGEYLLSAEGANLSMPEALRLQGSKLDLVLTLVPTAQRSTVQVTADAISASIDDSGKAVDVLDAESLSRRNEIFFLESLRLTPGLQVQQIGGPGATARIVTRGLRTADTSLLIDGFRFRDITSTQGEGAGLLPDLMLVNSDRFEVCRGSESTLYGTHAVGGVINMVTDPGGAQNGRMHGQLDFEGGGLGLLRGLGKLSGGEGKWQWTGALAHLNVLDGVDGNDRYRNTGTQGFVRYAMGRKTSLSGRMFSTEAFSQYNSGPGAKSGLAGLPGTLPGTFAYYTPQINDPDARRATRTIMGLAGLDHQFTPGLGLRVQYNRLYSNRTDENGPAGSGFQARFRDYSQFQGEVDTIAARMNWTWARRQVLLFGYEAEREKFYNFGDDFNPNAALRAQRKIGIRQWSNAFYAQQQFRIGSRLTVNLSGRVQSFQLQAPDFFSGTAIYGSGELASPPRAFTGDASLSYLLPGTNTKLRAHVGNAYRAPSLYERFGTTVFSGRTSVYGDPRLRPDRALSIDFGLDQYFWQSRIKASATYFYTRLQEVVGFGPVAREPYGRTSGYFNTGGALARGLETSIAMQATRKLSLQSSYTYTSTLERRPIFITGELASQRVFPHTYALTATYFFTRNFDASFDYFQASSYLVPFFSQLGNSFGSRAFRFEGPRKADIAARYRVPLRDQLGLEFFARLENLANRTYFEAGYQTPGFWGTGGIRLRF